jgi:hypothetical protein
MSIKLPVMRMLCYRWMLPQTVAEQCDYYFLDRPSFPDFANSLQMKDSRLHINRHGIDFEVVFQNGAEVTYADCIKKELAGDPCVQVTFWCSFRSLTFEWAGTEHKRAVVLVQPAREKVRSREPRIVSIGMPSKGFGGVSYTDLIGANVSVSVKSRGLTYADAIATSLDKMENENDNT